MFPPRLFPILALTSLLVLPAPAAEFVRAFGSFPTDVSPLSIVAGPDGYLYGISATGPKHQGATYRVASDKGKFELTHQFPPVRMLPTVNRGGSVPYLSPVIGRDGCVYGLTQTGGLYGQGLLFRVGPDRDFATIDLDFSQLLPDLPFNSLWGLFEGPDAAFYSYHLSGALIRIGRDGIISKVADIDHPGSAYVNFADPTFDDRFFSVSTSLPGGGPHQPPSQSRVHLLQIRFQDGAVLKEISSPDFPAGINSVYALPSDFGLLVLVEESGGVPGVHSKLYRLEDSGAMTKLATFGWGNPALPPRMNRFIHATTDGTIYYSTSDQRAGNIGVTGGRTLIELKPNGSFRTICGCGDYAMFNVVEMNGSLYGATYGTEVYVPKDQSGYQEEWMSPANAANYEIVKGSKKGGFCFQVALGDPALLDAAPVVDMDLINTRGARPVFIRPLGNDRDPERGALRIQGVGAPTAGDFQIAATQLLYHPEASGRRSAIASYDATDDHFQTATGTILIRGNAAGNYRDPGLSVQGRPFIISVKSGGTFRATVPGASGKAVTVSGKMDWYDQGLAGARQSSGEVVTLHIALAGEEAAKTLNYRIRQGDGTAIGGSAKVAPRP